MELTTNQRNDMKLVERTKQWLEKAEEHKKITSLEYQKLIGVMIDTTSIIKNFPYEKLTGNVWDTMFMDAFLLVGYTQVENQITMDTLMRANRWDLVRSYMRTYIDGLMY